MNSLIRRTRGGGLFAQKKEAMGKDFQGSTSKKKSEQIEVVISGAEKGVSYS